MTLVATLTAIGIWLVAIVVTYGILAYLVAFYFPPADQLESGAAVDAAFVFTFPFVLAATWFSTLRRK